MLLIPQQHSFRIFTLCIKWQCVRDYSIYLTVFFFLFTMTKRIDIVQTTYEATKQTYPPQRTGIPTSI
ncbi:hypothetical protein HanXRQr2_Chr04g0185471 [Helianthus annuus]|uniref:Uncharacterized protein n=1 Tax=Helianthus annuus TaxID=4232 RepID=A0A9K3JBF2_HELAN|nr:hypothetical protein HanXRQr2_Chr04g0185471 [Helianthus annuus]KAJ0590644.1 hypothetical protein HanIR_Chr04g0199791 [Helianthus annuus]KAJ0932904.1 hypothetical protein HanPSC8_Chr04g0179021 [Helianthus annuus]